MRTPTNRAFLRYSPYRLRTFLPRVAEEEAMCPESLSSPRPRVPRAGEALGELWSNATRGTAAAHQVLT